MFFKEFLRRKALRKTRQNLDVRYLNIGDFKCVGFVLSVDSEIVPEAINNMISILEYRGVEYKGVILNLYDKNNVIKCDNDNIIVLERGDVNFIGIPDISKVNDFIEIEYDVLIDFSLTYSFVSDYIVKSTASHFRIGRMNYTDHPYDFVISNDDVSHRTYISSLIHYLSSIKAL
jgi:hypothetical protein